MTAEIHKGDIGTKFLLTIEDNGVAIDISASTVKTIIFRRPDGVVRAKTAQFNTDGTDGKIYWTTTAVTDLDVTGDWHIQGYIEIGTGKWHTSVEDFTVEDNLN